MSKRKKLEPYFKGMNDAEKSAYLTQVRLQWVQAVILFVLSYVVIAGILFLVTGSLWFALITGVPAWLVLLKKWLFERLFGQTDADTIHILIDPFNRKRSERTDFTPAEIPTHLNQKRNLEKRKRWIQQMLEAEPLPGYIAIPPSTFYAKYIWQGVAAAVAIDKELVMSSKDLTDKENTLYTRDEKTISIGWLVSMTPLKISLKYIVNIVRFGVDEKTRHEYIKTKTLAYVAAQLRQWAQSKNYGDGTGEITMESFSLEFLGLFSGTGIHPHEAMHGTWAGQLDPLFCLLDPALQKARQQKGLLEEAMKMAAASVKGKKVDYVQVLQIACRALEIPLPEGMDFINLKVSGDPAMAAAFARAFEINVGNKKRNGK